ncbi:hypothetical protein BKA66DRAFT_569854 [Pyrenochaeta sp. MPI-SDFR-AT-0127]|nr:hypothetical protein BKA66DRAFT_569854 [Pyrenochaeta sp. MPI-SDFR-AT-0127]
MSSEKDNDLGNPTLRSNWPDEPETLEEFETWIDKTREGLLKWLEKTRNDAQEEQAKKEVLQETNEAAECWAKFEPHTDVQTGTIHDDEAQREMEEAMGKQQTSLNSVHKKHQTEIKHEKRMLAESCWEDFLYYQNVWNRKGFRLNKNYFLNKREHDAASEVIGLGKEVRDPNKAKKRVAPRNLDWRDHMIMLYIKFQLGYRKNMPKLIEPENAHRYSQPSRGTTNTALGNGQQRFVHLELRFPRKRRTVPDVTEMEEYSPDSEKAMDDQLIENEEWEPIKWQLDDSSYKALQEVKERKYRSDPRTKALLPRDHVLHHGSTETSFDWPTSFDSAEWGNHAAVTAKRKRYIFEEITGEKSASDEGHNDTNDELPRKRKKIDRRPRYSQTIGDKPGPVFIYDRDKNGTVKFSKQTKEGLGHWEQRMIRQEVFQTNEDGSRIRLPDDHCIQNEFEVHNVRFEDLEDINQQDIRPNKPQEGGEGKELSDDETQDRVTSNKNFAWSGTNNPSQIGKAARRTGRSDNLSAFGIDSDGDESDSDDNGDLFTISYRDGSVAMKSRMSKHASRLLDRLTSELGEFPPLNVEKTLSLVKAGTSYEEIEQEYLIWARLYNE